MEATRGVKFILKAQTDGSVGTEFAALNDRVAAVQKAMNEIRFGTPNTDGVVTAVDMMNQAYATHQEAVNGHAHNGAANRARIAQQEAATAGTADDKAAERRRAAKARAFEADQAYADKLADMVARANEETTANQIKELKKAQAERERAHAQEAIEIEKAAGRHQAALDKERAADEKYWSAFVKHGEDSLSKRQAAETKAQAQIEKVQAQRRAFLDKEKSADKDYWDSFVAYGEKATEKRGKDDEKAAKKAEQEQKRTHDAMERNSRRVSQLADDVRMALSDAAGGAMELARGFVEAGLIGEQDFDKVKDSLLRVQSAMDLVRGGINVWHYLSTAARYYQERVEAIAKAEELAAAVRAAGGAVNGASAVASGGAAATSGAGTIAGAAPILGIGAAVLAAGTGVVLAFRAISEELHHANGTTKGNLDELGYAVDSWTHKITEMSKGGFISESVMPVVAGGLNRILPTALGGGYGDRGVGPSVGDFRDQQEREKAARRREIEERAAYVENLANEFAKETTSRKQQAKLNETRAKIDMDFGAGREKLESEADQKGLQGSDREQFISDRQQSAEIDRKMEEAKAAYESAQKYLDALREEGYSVIDPEREKEALDALNEAGQQQIDLEMQRAAIERQMQVHALASLQQQLNLQQQQVQKAKELADALKKAVDDSLADFGQLTIVERKELMHIREIVDQGGELTDKQEQLAGQHGDETTKEYVRKRRIERSQREIEEHANADGTRGSHMFDRETERRDAAGNALREREAERDKTLGEARQQSANVTLNADNTFNLNLSVEWTEKAMKPIMARVEKMLQEAEQRIKENADNADRQLAQRRAQAAKAKGV